MLVFLKHNLAFLAVPKTGTTALETALRGQADIVLKRRTKHMTAQKFHRRMAPFLRDTYGVSPDRLAVMRDPLDQIRSWYRYRQAEARAGDPRSTQGIGFDDFVLATLETPQPPFAAIGSQFFFLSGGQGELRVTHLFSYERQAELRRFLELRLGRRLSIPEKNRSADAPTPLSPAVEARLREVRAADFALYDRLMAADGFLETEIA